MDPEKNADLDPEREDRSEGVRPAIYIASLSDYNDGRLHGEWIDATIGADAINERVQRILATSPDPTAEEYAIHDYEDFGDKRIGESERVEDVARLAEGIKHHGLAFAAWIEYSGLDPEDWHYFEEAYLGRYDDLSDYADQIVEDMDWLRGLDEIPEDIRRYVKIDTEAMGEDMRLSGEVYALDAPGGIWVFSSRIG